MAGGCWLPPCHLFSVKMVWYCFLSPIFLPTFPWHPPFEGSAPRHQSSFHNKSRNASDDL